MCASSQGPVNERSGEEKRGVSQAPSPERGRARWQELRRFGQSSHPCVNRTQEMNPDQYPVWPDPDHTDLPQNPYSPA